ncbi:hypothetical protein KKI17_02790 [Patescibacteria group bacterium]|nr:hypothetical protein [Patescibacteria group bacterium]
MVEFIPKEQREPWRVRLLFPGAVMLLVFAVAAAVLFPYLQGQEGANVAVFEQELRDTSGLNIREMEKTIEKNSKKLTGLVELAQTRRDVRQAFAALESVTHHLVYFTGTDFRTEEGTFGLSGRTETFRTLREQLEIFRAALDISTVELSDLALPAEGGVSFRVVLTLSPQVFK